MDIDSSSTVEIRASTENIEAKTVFESVVKVSSGVASFENIGFAADPGSTDVKFTI